MTKITDKNDLTLTIGIPTYNRPELLCRRIKEVEKFAESIDELVICDNSKNIDTNVQEALKVLPIDYIYKQNRGNIGGGANFIRVVENSSSKYLWWRGDDDVISITQMEAVINSITNKPRLIMLSLEIDEIFIGNGIEEFVENFHKIEPVGWLSQIVLPVEIAHQALSWGYYGISSGWTPITLVLGLFRVCPELDFVIMPIKLSKGEFREGGREYFSWPFFNTCIRQFPLTASVLETELLRSKYLKNWRITHKFKKRVLTMFRLKMGYMRVEKLTLKTFLPLFNLTDPKSTLLGIVLYIMSKIPPVCYQLVFTIFWFRMAEEKKSDMGLDHLLPCKSYVQVFRALRANKNKDLAVAFI